MKEPQPTRRLVNCPHARLSGRGDGIALDVRSAGDERRQALGLVVAQDNGCLGKPVSVEREDASRSHDG